MAKRNTSIEELMEMWSKDSQINIDNLAIESTQNPALHSKYLNYRTYHNMVAKAINSEYIELKKLKTEYYNGLHNTDTEFLQKYKLEPIRNMILKTDIPLYLESDKDLMPLLLKKIANEEIVSYCDEVIRAIKNRDWSIRNSIDFLKFTNGMG